MNIKCNSVDVQAKDVLFPFLDALFFGSVIEPNLHGFQVKSRQNIDKKKKAWILLKGTPCIQTTLLLKVKGG